MSRVAGVRGIRKITETLIDAGCDALKRFTKAAREDRVESELSFKATQTLKGKYGIGDSDEVGLILSLAAPIADASVDAGADVSLESSQTGDADVTLTISLEISARDRAKEDE